MIWRLLSSTVNAWIDDYAPSMGAALAFYTLFSIAPLLLLWVYYSAQVLLLGAEFTWVFAHCDRSASAAPSPATPQRPG